MRLLALSLLLFYCTYAAKDKLDKKTKGKGGSDEVLKLSDDITVNGKDKTKDSNGNGLKKKNQKVDKTGKKITRMQQEYDDIPVFGFDIIVQEVPDAEITIKDKKTGKPTGKKIKLKKEKKVRGHFAGDLKKDLGKIDKAKLKPQEALDKLKKSKGYKGGKTANEKAETIIYVDKKTGKAQVAYLVSFLNKGAKPAKPMAILDENFEIITEWDDLHTIDVELKGEGPGGNEKVGRIWHDHLPVSYTSSGKCRFLSDTVKVVNAEDNSNEAFEFECFKQLEHEVNGGFSPLNDLMQHGTAVFNMYLTWYHENPFPDQYLPVRLYAHFAYSSDDGTIHEDSAYWDGWNAVFGDGGTYYYPMVSLPVVAHELTHGVVGHSSQLVYEQQSGGLNEAFSDMAGKAAERFYYKYGPTTIKWDMFYDIAKVGVKRCMDNPPCDGRSIDHMDKYYPSIDVHYSSGIFNKVFYLLSNKFKYDLWDAFDLFYLANGNCWVSRTDFIEAAECVLDTFDEMQKCLHLNACYENDIADVTDAFQQVGIHCSRNEGEWECQA